MISSFKGKILVFILIYTCITTVTYLNHFDNSFHFDDSHTIQNNVFIKSLKNIPAFFQDGTTFSSLPQNQTYRPVVSTTLAIDYWLGGGFHVFFFHLSTFLVFLMQGILMFFLFYKILNLVSDDKNNFFIAAAAVLWYSLHPANAETVNYIISRSDIQSTSCVVLAFALYQYSSFCKKTFLYLLPVGIGALAKPSAAMFAPMLLFYKILFEQEMSLYDIFRKESAGKLLHAIKTSIPAFLFCGLLFYFIHVMTPESWTPGGVSSYNYAISQPMVLFHYVQTFFLPLWLSADTDWKATQSILSLNFIVGVIFVAALVVTAFTASGKKEHRPVSFGIIWFFLALLPVSSFIPFAEILNDHRLYFPYVGLVISVCWAIGLLYMKFRERVAHAEKIILIFAAIIFISYGFGTIQRNKVWQSEESLWKDVTLKSPKNGRGLMNYGLVKMREGNFASADEYFQQALKFNPYYPTLFVNLGISGYAQKKIKEAEAYFKKAILYGSKYDYPWFYYGQFLMKESRFAEAVPKLEKAYSISNVNFNVRLLLTDAYYETEDWEKLKLMAEGILIIDNNNAKAKVYLKACETKKGKLVILEENIDKEPSAEKYLNLSLDYYKRGLYRKCISLCEKAILLKPDYAEAWNNICSAQNSLGNYDEAEKACKQAVRFRVGYQLAINNLNEAVRKKEEISKSEQAVKTSPSVKNYINLSLKYYQQGKYEKCIEAAKKAIELDPRFAQGYNNIGAAYNRLMRYDKAIEALNKALEIDPGYKLAGANLQEAKQGLKLK